MKGVLSISLDFELHWGGFEKWPLNEYKIYFSNTRQVIPEMLDAFATRQVHVTWATVGILFHQSREELLENFPDLPPTYVLKNLSALHYIREVGIGENEVDDPFHFAPSLIRKIYDTPGQEIGTHTFGHYYCNEAGQTIDQFKADLAAAQTVAASYGVELRSLVFPRNQFNDQYLRVCFEAGIKAVRSNPLDWFWRIGSTHNESFWKRLNRGLDAYFPIGKNNTFNLDILKPVDGLPVSIPASRLLRPYNPREFFLNTLKIERIKSEMTRAAKLGQVYHLWWHPHNFGGYPKESMEGLNSILDHYTHCRKKYGMTSMTMGELADAASEQIE